MVEKKRSQIYRQRTWVQILPLYLITASVILSINLSASVSLSIKWRKRTRYLMRSLPAPHLWAYATKRYATKVPLNFSETSDKVSHTVFVGNMEKYRLGWSKIKGIWNSLIDWTQRTIINSLISTYREDLNGAPQLSFLGTVLFNILISDMDKEINSILHMDFKKPAS